MDKAPLQLSHSTMTDRISDCIRGDKFEEFITAQKLLVYVEKKLKNSDNLLWQVLLMNLKRRAEFTINDYSTSVSTQKENASPSEIVKYFFETEDDDDDIVVVTIQNKKC